MNDGPKRSVVDLNPDGSPTKETLKRAMKAFRKRLKLTRLDQVSTAGRNPLSYGAKSAIMAVTPPEHYPSLVWEALAEAVQPGRCGPCERIRISAGCRWSQLELTLTGPGRFGAEA